MKAEKIELGKFYQYAGDEYFTIFIFCLEYYSFKLGNTPTECEKWILGSREKNNWAFYLFRQKIH